MPQLMQSNKQLRVLEWFVILMYNQPDMKMSTRHRSSFFRKVPEALKVFRRAKLQLNRTSRGQHIKWVKFGVKS